MSPVLIGLALYMGLMLVVGAWMSRKVHSVSDYLVAGRSMGMMLISFSVFATWFGAEAILATAGVVYSDGMRGAAVDPFGYVLALFVNGVFFAAALWRGGYTTFADLYASRFGQHAERVSACLFILASVPWASVQFRAFGQVLSLHSNVGLSTSILLGAAFLLAYTSLGGLLADAVTDLIQGVVVIIGLLIIGTCTAVSVGGVSQGLSQIDPERLKFFAGTGQGVLGELEYWAIPILGTCLSADIIQRILGARTANAAGWGTILGASIYLLVALVPIFLGLVGPQLVPDLEDPEQLVSVLASRYLSGILLVAFSGALVSIILSTADSLLLTCGGVISQNLIMPLLPQIGDRGRLLASRCSVVVVAAAAYVLAVNADRMFDLIYLGAQAGSSGILVTACFGLFTRFGGERSALAAMLVGVVVWATGYSLGMVAPFLTSLAASFLAYCIATLRFERTRSSHDTSEPTTA